MSVWCCRARRARRMRAGRAGRTGAVGLVGRVGCAWDVRDTQRDAGRVSPAEMKLGAGVVTEHGATGVYASSRVRGLGHGHNDDNDGATTTPVMARS